MSTTTRATRIARYAALSLFVWAALCITAVIGWGLSLAWGRGGWLFGIGCLLFGPVVLAVWGCAIGVWRMGKRV